MISSTPATPRFERDRPVEQMTEEELRKEYIHLRKMNASLAEESAVLQGEISALCEESVRFQQSTEIEEEKLANQLLRRLQSEKLQRRRYLDLIHREESSRQQIMQQITQVRGEKTEVETQLAQEQESLMLQVQKKLIEVVNKKSEVERELLKERHDYLDMLSTQLALIKQGSLTENSNIEVSSQTMHKSSEKVFTRDLPTDTYDAVNRLEKQLNKLLSEHAEAVQANLCHESVCAELRCRLERIQEAAFLDRARASKLREELLEAKRRLGSVAEQRRQRGASVISDDSSGLPTPTRGSLRGRSFFSGAPLMGLGLGVGVGRLSQSGETSEVGEEGQSSSSIACTPPLHCLPRPAASEESTSLHLSSEPLPLNRGNAKENEEENSK